MASLPATGIRCRRGLRVIVICGEALIDFTLARVGKAEGYRAHPGGSPYNVAVGLGRLEVRVAFLGRISQDFFGERLRQNLRDNGVDVRYVREGREPSTLAFVHAPKGAEPQFAFYGEGTADRRLRPEDVPAAFPADVHALHFGSISLVLEPAATTLEGVMRREHGRHLVSLDPNVRPGLIADRDAYRARLEGWVRAADVVKVSRADLSWLYPEDPVERIAERWKGLGPALVVVTLGREGAEGWGNAGMCRVPGMRVRVVDTVGAGDAFTSGLLAWVYRSDRLTRGGVERLSTDELAAALGYANRVAALTCTRAGADPPRRAEVDAEIGKEDRGATRAR
jgi:fructokinase